MTIFNSDDYEVFLYDADDDRARNDQASERNSGPSGLHKIVGGAGEDHLLGTVHGDLMIGKGGNDHFASLGGDDRLIGGTGADVLDGGGGADRLVGGAGGDYLMGSTGNDTMTGGSGLNQFGYQEEPAKGSDRDVITDFDRGKDHLNLMRMPLGDSEGGYRFIGRHEFGGAGEVRIDGGKHGGVNVLINMDSDHEAEVIIHLRDVSKLTSDDFYF